MNGISTRALTLAALSLATIVVFLLLNEHWGHVLGFLPYAILLACPLLHLFHGHGSHEGHSDAADRARSDGKRGGRGL